MKKKNNNNNNNNEVEIKSNQSSFFTCGNCNQAH